jgi:lipoprotein signal peptidase
MTELLRSVSTRSLTIAVVALSWIVVHELIVQLLQSVGIPVVATNRFITVVPGIASWVGACILFIIAVRYMSLPRKSIGALGLVLGAMISNALSFIRYGAVQDYIPFFGILINLSDIVISLGLFLFLYRYYRKLHPE